MKIKVKSQKEFKASSGILRKLRGRGYPLHCLCAFKGLRCKSWEEDGHNPFRPDNGEDDPSCTKKKEHAHPDPMKSRSWKQKTPKAIQRNLFLNE